MEHRCRNNEEIKGLIVRFLDGSITPNEEDTLLSWIESSKENEQLFMDSYNLWGMTRTGQLKFDRQAALKKIRQHIRHADRQRKQLFIFRCAVAAACLAFVAFSSVYFLRKERGESDIARYAHSNLVSPVAKEVQLVLSKQRTIRIDENAPSLEYAKKNIKLNSKDVASKEESGSYNQLIVPYGKRSVITFADGTKVWLNAGTKLIYPIEFAKHQREIYVNGEIYLEVTHDDKRPFIVHTRDMNIRVLGTVFDVLAYESESVHEVVLVSGRVEVSSLKKGGKALLQPNQLCSLSGRHLSVKEVDAFKYTLWKEGLYLLESERLVDILRMLEKYYNKRIQCSSSIANLKCSGLLDMKENLEEVLHILCRTTSLKYQWNTNDVYQVMMDKDYN